MEGWRVLTWRPLPNRLARKRPAQCIHSLRRRRSVGRERQHFVMGRHAPPAPCPTVKLLIVVVFLVNAQAPIPLLTVLPQQ